MVVRKPRSRRGSLRRILATTPGPLAGSHGIPAGHEWRRGGDPLGAVGEPAAVRLDRSVQCLRQPADADRSAVHAADLRPGADLALGGDAGGADRHRRLPVPDDGAARPRAGAGAGPRGRTLPGAPGFPRSGGDPDPGGPLDGVALGAGDGPCRPRVDAALRLGSGPVRVLRRAVDTGVPVRAVRVPLAAGGAGGGLGGGAAGAAELGAHRAAAGRGGGGVGAGGAFRGAAPRGRRDGARARHAGLGDGARGLAARHCAGAHGGDVGPRRRRAPCGCSCSR